MLKESLDAKNLLEALGSFSEDEGLLADDDSDDERLSGDEGERDAITDNTTQQLLTEETTPSLLKTATIKPPTQPVSQLVCTAKSGNYHCSFLL